MGRLRGLRLGQDPSTGATLVLDPTIGMPPGPSVVTDTLKNALVLSVPPFGLVTAYNDLIVPGSSPADVASNAFQSVTGAPALTPAQQANLAQQEQAELIQAGMDPGDAAAQSQADVASAVALTNPGGTNWLLIGGIAAGALALFYFMANR
jgi:hypothetical protein